MHEETAIDAMAGASVKKTKAKYKKKQRKGKLSAEVHATTTKVNKAKEKKKKAKISKKELEVIKRVKSLREQRIKDISERIKKAAENGKSYIQISALWSDAVEIRLLQIIQEWARKQGFEIDTSYSDIYKSPRSSDDLPSDTRSFLTINWE